MSRPHILVRPPSPGLAAAQLTHLARVEVDPDLAVDQWRAYVAVFVDHGWAVTELEPLDAYPDGVFVEDTVVIFDELAVLASPGAPSRVGEVASTARVLPDLGLEIGRIRPPAHLDGGDVLKIDRTAYVGLSTRTDCAGFDQLRALVEPRGWRVIAVPVRRVLHLKSAVTALPDGTVIGYPPHVDDPDGFETFLAVPEEHGTAVVDLGGGSVVMSAGAPRTAELLRERGLTVITTPMTEFEKLEGCVTCLSVRLR
jgi:dimethylargininase